MERSARMGLFKQEWVALFKDKKMLISVIGILFIPIMYSGMLLWANWNPYDRLNDLPVAIVNNDTGAELDGEKIKLGNELVDRLKKSKDFDFQFVDRKTGYQNLENQKCYLLIEIPKNFSKNATTLMDDEPKKLELKYRTNDSYNFLSSQIGETAVKEMKVALSEQVTETYAETMFDVMTKMADGYQSTDKASEKLQDGIAKLNDGAKTLEEKLTVLAEKQLKFTGGTTKLEDGTAELQKGAVSLADGLGQLATAQDQLIAGAKDLESGGASLQTGIQQTEDGLSTVQEKMNEVVAGTEKIHDGSAQLSDSLQQFETGANEAANGAAELTKGIATLQAQLEPVLATLPEENQTTLKQALSQLSEGATQLESGNKQLAASSSQLASGATSLTEKVTTLNDGQKSLQTGVSQLSDGASKLVAGADEWQAGQIELRTGLTTFGDKLANATSGSKKLATGSTTVADGVATLKTGSTALADGSSQLAAGSGEIVVGTSKLVEGSTEFKDEINKAATDAADIDADEKTYNMVAEPVQVKKESLTKVDNYGTGIAPYFLSLGLFVGALMLSIIFPFRDPVGVPKTAFSWFVSKASIIVMVGTLQALIVSAIVLWVLDMNVQNVPLFIVFTILTSLTFLAIIQFLVTTMENPGRFLAIILLIFQLVTSAGTFPNELLPTPLQGFNDILPMAYSVRGFKAVISSGDFSFMWQNGFVLIGYIISFMVLTLLYFIMKHKKSYSGVSETVE